MLLPRVAIKLTNKAILSETNFSRMVLKQSLAATSAVLGLYIAPKPINFLNPSIFIVSMIIGITGIFCSGKSSVAKLFEENGFTHIDADTIGHAFLENEEIKQKLLNVFGNEILKDNKIDRKTLRKKSFKNIITLGNLNAIMLPSILAEIKKQAKESPGNAILSIPLLYETQLEAICDKVIVMKITPELQEERALAKGWTKEDIEHINRAQLSQDTKLQKADIVVDNTGNEEELKKKVVEVIKGL